MKILVVSNLYPPHHIGGYELGCRDVVEKLRARGNLVEVLTSTFRRRDVNDFPDETSVERSLQLYGDPTAAPPNKLAECAKLSAAIRRFEPEVVYFWNQGGLCLWLPLAVRWHGKSYAFFLSDTNFVSWRIAAWLGGSAQKISLVRAVFSKTFLVRGKSILENRRKPAALASRRKIPSSHTGALNRHSLPLRPVNAGRCADCSTSAR